MKHGLRKRYPASLALALVVMVWLVSASSVSAKDIVRCVDALGTTSYVQTQCPDGTTQRAAIQVKPAAPLSVQPLSRDEARAETRSGDPAQNESNAIDKETSPN